MTLWCFEPNILAHAQLITPDAVASALGLTTCYLFRNWLKEPTWAQAFFAGLVLGFAELTKASWLLLAPVLALLTLVSSQTGFNHHLRYVLPIFPFGFIWLSKIAQPVSLHRPWILMPAAAGLLWAVTSSLWYYPHSLSYFNELVGGPENGHAHLVDSNIDWGQDLLFLKGWLDEHPEARPLRLAYFGGFDPGAAGIKFRLPPYGPPRGAGSTAKTPGPEPGWFAVSVCLLRGLDFPVPDGTGKLRSGAEYPFVYFQDFQRMARTGYSIYIYHITPEQAAEGRRRLDATADK